MFRIALIAAALVAGSAHAQDLDALKVDTRKNALPVLPKVVGMMQETVAAKGPVEAIPVCKEKAPELLKEHYAHIAEKPLDHVGRGAVAADQPVRPELPKVARH